MGYQSFDDAFAVTDDYFYYCIEGVDGNGVPTGQWEEGIGHLSGSTTLVRDTLLASSTGSAVSFSAGTKNVFCTVAARDFERLHSNVPKVYKATLTQSATDAPVATVFENSFGAALVWTRDGAGIYTLTLTGAFPSGKVFFPANFYSVPWDGGSSVSIYRTSDNTLSLEVATDGVIPADGMPFEVFVYP